MKYRLRLFLVAVFSLFATSAFGWDFEYDADVDPYQLVDTDPDWAYGSSTDAGPDYDNIVPSAEAQTGNAILDRNDDNSATNPRFYGLQFGIQACDAEWPTTLKATVILRAKNLETDYDGGGDINEEGKALFDVFEVSSSRWNLSQTENNEWVLDCYNDRNSLAQPMLVSEANDWHVIRVVVTSDGTDTTYTVYYDEDPTPIQTVTHAETIGTLRFELSRSSGGNTQHWQIDWIRAEVGEAWSPTEGDLLPGAGTTARAGPDQTVLSNDTVTLNGAASSKATSWTWEQTAGTPTVSLNPTADPAIVTFTAPTLTVGTLLTFQLTVTGETGTSTDTVDVTVRARNAPAIAPGNIVVRRGHLSFTFSWDPLIDADAYGVGVEVQEGVYFFFSADGTTHKLENLSSYTEYKVVVRGTNSYGDGVLSEPLTLLALPNLALPAPGGPTPPLPPVQGETYVISHYDINGMNNRQYDDNNDSWDGNLKGEDFWGFLWGQDLFFDQLVYYEGENFSNGGWWTDLTVQFTQDGGETWINAPEVTIDPPYKFADSRTGRRAYSRFDVFFKPVRGNGIRLRGVPGGSADFTSIAELETYGDQNQGPLVVYGVDAAFDERSEAVLDGSYSFSTRGSLSGFNWVQTGGPEVTIADPSLARTTFTAPSVDEDTVLTFQFTAGDGTDSYTDDVYITVRNLKTTAVAGPDRAVTEGQAVSLDATGSVSTSGSLTYSWRQIEGIPGTFDDANSPTATFTTPFVYRFSDECILELQVNDGLGNPDSVSTDTLAITVNDRHGALIILEAENYTSTSNNGDIRSWAVVQGDPTYVTTEPAPGENAPWATACELSYAITIPTAGPYTLLLRRYADDSGTNSCQVGVDGIAAIAEFDNQGTDDVWVWFAQPGQFITFDSPGSYSLSLRRREGGYRIDKLILYAGNPVGVPAVWSTEVGPPEGNWVGPIFCDRSLGSHYIAGAPLPVDFTIDVNMETPPATLVITENIPAGFTVASAEGNPDLGTQGKIVWTLTGADVDNRTLRYTVNVPSGTTGAAAFQGGMTYGSVFNQPIGGQQVVYPLPPAPTNLNVEMLLVAYLTWSPRPPEEGVSGYCIYRSVNGLPYEQIAFVTTASYVDRSVEPANTYSYEVSAVNVNGAEGAASLPTAQSMMTMQVREAEDYNYGGGQYPGYQECPAAVEATAQDDLAAGNDFFFASDYPVGDPARAYRPNDNLRTAVRDSTRYIGSITVGDWWRYSFDVPQPGVGDPAGGWVKLAFRVSSPSEGTLAAYWDEELVGSITFATGDWGAFDSFPLEEQVQTDPGVHTLRVTLAAGEMNFDTLGIGFNWTPPSRQVIFEDHFEDYTTLYLPDDVIDAGWSVLNGSGYTLARWRLWNTDSDTTDWLSNEDPNIAGMTNNYMITDSDLAPDAAMDEELITPEIDCTDWIRLRLNFNKNFRVYIEDTEHLQVGEVDIRTYDEDTSSWGDWVNLLRFDSTTGSEIESDPEQVDLSAYDENRIQIRWHFSQAQYDYWFAVDDVVLSGEKKAPPPPPPLFFDWTRLSWAPFGGGNYTVEYTDDLATANWQPVPGFVWPIVETTWLWEPIGTWRARYYRVRSE